MHKYENYEVKCICHTNFKQQERSRGDQKEVFQRKAKRYFSLFAQLKKNV